MEMDVQIERPAEPLNHHNPARAAVLDSVIARTVGEHPKHRAEQHAGDLAAEIVIPRQEIPQWAARSAIRRPPQLGHSARPLQENGTHRSKPQPSQ
jgi:hypothetical protein